MSSVVKGFINGFCYYRPRLPSWGQSKSVVDNVDQLRGIQAQLATCPYAKKSFNDCFSRYVNNSVAVDSEALATMSKVVLRMKEGQELAGLWEQIIPGGAGSFGSSHARIPNAGLMKRALQAQCIFESQHLLRLKQIDRLERVIHERVSPEIDLLKRRIYAMESFWASKSFTPEEQKFLGQFSKKAAHFNISELELLKSSVGQKQALLLKLRARINALRAQKLSPALSAWTEPNSDSMRELLGRTKMCLKMERGFRQPITGERQSVHSSIRDHYVVTVGDSLNDKKAVFLMVKKPAEIPNRIWEQLISRQGTGVFVQRFQAMLPKLKPNQEFPMRFLCEGRMWEVKASYELVNETVQLHEDRDHRKKMRRRALGHGLYERENRDIAQGVKGWAKRAWRNLLGGWSKHNVATAGADCHELISMGRNMIFQVLRGNMSSITFNTTQNLGEYFDCVPNSDTARLPGSFGSYEPFLQALNIHQMVHGSLTEHHKSATIVKNLQEALETEFKWDKHAPNKLEDLFRSYRNWEANLNAFLQDLDQNPKAKAVFDRDTITQLRAFSVSLKQFLDQSIPPEMIPILNRTANWSGKTSSEIDLILSKAVRNIQQHVSSLTQCLALINVPFSSPFTQGRIGKRMQAFPTIYNNYQRSIPLIWQNKVKIQDVIGQLVKGTDLSPLWLDQVKSLATAQREVVKTELIRSRQAKLALS